MRFAPVEMQAELIKDAHFTAHLLELYFSTTLYFTDLDIDIFYNGHQYLSRGLHLDDVQYSITAQIDKSSFEIDNTDLAFTVLVQQQEVRGRKCIIRTVSLTDYAQVIAAMTKFAGIIDEYKILQKARFDVYSPLILWKRKTPRRIHQATCPWKFKQTSDDPDEQTCRYAGPETWCDQSYERCLALNNTDNFGGERFMPSLQNKAIWWGRVPA